jgi:hypothetical protein
MTIDELYEKLSSRQFQDTQNGDLFYNFFVYQYPADKEYEIRQQIKEFKEQLIRPINYVDVLTMNLFEEFCNFLDGQSFGKLHPSYLKYLIEKDGSNPDSVTKTLTNKANSDAFYEYVHNKIIQHISIKDDKNRPYIFLYGIGSMYPYLRTNVFLTNYEKYNQSSNYKLIVFYPGNVNKNTYHLFGMLNDEHTYRATLLINDR